MDAVEGEAEAREVGDLGFVGFLWQGGWLFSIIVAALAYAWFMRSDRSRITAAEYEAITEVETTVAPRPRGAPETTPA